MPLTIEDGTIVSGANSFATVAQARAYALLRGTTLSATDSVVEVLLVKAMDYLVHLESRFQGTRVSRTQELPFPRSGVVLLEEELADTEMPSELVKAQCALVIEALTKELLPAGDTRIVKSKKVDVLETVYQDTSEKSPVPSFPRVEAILAPLFENGGGFELNVVRV